MSFLSKLSSLSLKTKVTMAVLLLFLCVIWLLTFFISARWEQELTAQIEAQQFSIASYIADSIENQINLRISSLTAIASLITPELIANPAKAREFLRGKPLLITLFRTGVLMLSTEGKVITDYPAVPGRPGKSLSAREYFRDVVASGKPAVGKPVIGNFSKKPIIGFAVPILDRAGKLMGVLAGNTLLSDPTILGTIESSVYKGSPDRLLVASPKYRIYVTGSDPTRIMTPTPEPGVNPLFDRFKAGFEGSGITVNSRGIRILLSAKQIPTPGWFVRVGLPTEIAFAPIHNMKHWAYSIAIGLSLLSSLFVWFLIRQTLSQLYAASNLIRNMTEERLPLQNIPVTQYDEVGQLLTSFNAHLNYRKKAEESLSENEEYFRGIASVASDAIVRINENGEIVFWNKAAEMIFGYSAEDAVGKDMHLLLSPERFREAYIKGFSEFKKTGNGNAIGKVNELIAIRKDGIEFPVEVSLSPIKVKDKWHAVGIIRDITDRMKAEEALVEQQKFSENLLQNSAIAAFVLDKNHTVMIWNKACEELTGVHASDIIGTNKQWMAFYSHDRPTVADVIIDKQHERLPELYTKYSKSVLNPLGIRAEGWYKNLGGKDRYIVFEASPIFNASGELIAAIETLQDISDSKRLEEQLRQSQKMEAMGRLSGGIAHDFNNLMTAVIGYSDLVLSQLPEKHFASDKISIIRDAGDKAAALVRQILAFSRNQLLEMKPVNLNEIVSNMNKIFSRTIGEDIELELNITKPVKNVLADAGQIEQILMNLVVNARDAMPNGGRLIIETDSVYLDETYALMHSQLVKPGPYVTLSVTDNGAGMSQEIKEKIFDPFFTTKGTGKGTGLGLSTTYGIIEQHNGYIWVYSEPGQGTTFKVYLPTIEEEAKELKKDEPSTTVQGTETILVVDDDPMIRQFVIDVLQPLAYTLYEADCGEEALKIAEQVKGKIDLLLTDLVMPVMKGTELRKLFIERWPNIKVIIMSGYGEKEIIDQEMKDTIFIQKPITPGKLTTKLREVLDKGTI